MGVWVAGVGMGVCVRGCMRACVRVYLVIRDEEGLCDGQRAEEEDAKPVGVVCVYADDTAIARPERRRRRRRGGEGRGRRRTGYCGE